MRTIDEIKKSMTDKFISYSIIQTLYGLDPTKDFESQFSKASLESIIFYAVANAMHTLESLFYYFVELVDDKIRNQRAHTIGWYRTQALNFQFGGILKDDVTEYDNSALTDEQIQAQKIITKCAITKADNTKPTLIIKVAKASGKLTDEEKTAFTAYMEAIADAGVNIVVVSENADRLVLWLKIRFDAMVMDANGVKFSDGSRPVNDGVTEHLNNLVFNGTFYPSMLEQYLMSIQGNGVRIATDIQAQAGISGGTLNEITDKYEPNSGAIECDVTTDLHVTYERF